MPKPIRKAVFPVAGLGTRNLPATKAIPKEMLTIVDKPLIQYAIEEAKAAGIEQFYFVTGRAKGAIEDHFDVSFELEATLSERGRGELLGELQSWLPAAGDIAFTRQQRPLGLGHAVWCARHMVGDEPFAVLLPDDLMVGKPVPFAAKIKRETRATRSMLYLWTGEVPADGQGYRVLATGAKGSMEVPSGVAKNYPCVMSVRLYGMNANGKVYALDKAYQLSR